MGFRGLGVFGVWGLGVYGVQGSRGAAGVRPRSRVSVRSRMCLPVGV